MSSVIVPIIVGVLCALIFGVIGFVFGGEHRRKTSEKEIGSATQQATKIINNALNEAEATKKARLVEAKDEIHKLRHDADKEIRERRTEVQKQENRLIKEKNILIKEQIPLKRKMKISALSKSSLTTSYSKSTASRKASLICSSAFQVLLKSRRRTNSLPTLMRNLTLKKASVFLKTSR